MKQGSTLGGTLLVAGTTIGAGMLALPVVTGLSGLFPSLATLCIYWLASLCTSFLFLEVNMAFDTPVNFVTMAKKTLGKPGKIIAWGIYLLLLYCLTAAYIAGSKSFMGSPIGPVLFLLIFGSLVAFKTRIIDHANRFLMIGLLVSYVLLLTLGLPFMHKELLMHVNWSGSWSSIPVVVTAFGFQIIIPTLTTYLHRDVKRIKIALAAGSAMAFAFYVLFLIVMLGSLPLDMIQEANKGGEGATDVLAKMQGDQNISLIATIFAFFAITTSFIGVSLALRDFLADGFKFQAGNKRVFLLLLTYVPPLVFVIFYPRAFLVALEFAGSFVALLLGIWPVLMVYRKRQMRLSSYYKFPGGTLALLGVLFIYITVIVIGFIKS